MVFLPGDHVLDRTITVVNVTRLTMHGEFSSGNVATVVRNGSVGFSFTNMVDFNIYFLAFTSYNRSLSYGSYSASNSALFLQSTPSVKLVNCSFHDNLGTALAVYNTNVTLAENSRFIRNQCACQSFSGLHGYGCGITALNSSLIFIGESFFCENNQTTSSSSNCAGAIWASASSLHFNGTNSFINNSANGNTGVGGAIYAKSYTTLSFIGTSEFSHNSADFEGGAINVETNSLLSFSGTSDFSHNSADFEGGAINAKTNSSLIFSGTSNFSHNSANDDGGAIYADINSSLNFTGNSNFSNNSANSGGAIYADINSYLSFSGTSDFSHNSAGYGGAINADTNSSLIFSGTSDFSHNSAHYEGGAIYADTKSYLSFSGTSDFSHNSAHYEGGAIKADTNSSLIFSGNSDFSHNSALFGGAIFSENSYLSFNGISNFSHNSANFNGGAIIAYISVVLTFTGTSSFSSNFAMQGGAISAYFNSTLMFDGNICFTNNGDFPGIKRDSHGGAIYLFIGSTFSITHDTTVYWENNHAKLGGAIYVFDVNFFNYYIQIVTPFVPNEKCFFQLPGQNLSNDIDTFFFTTTLLTLQEVYYMVVQ